MKRKIISLISAAALIFSAMPVFMASAENHVTISSVDDLIALRDAVNSGNTYEDYIVILAKDLNLNGSADNQWVPIGKPLGNGEQHYSFDGTFDGQNHKISGLYINTSDDYAGLFGNVGIGEIKNLEVSGTVSGGQFSAGIAGSAHSLITNCQNNCTVSGSTNVGGVAGYNPGTTIKNCRNTGNITGTTNVGGVVGGSVWKIENCYNTGNVTGGTNAGGIVGGTHVQSYVDVWVKNCYNTGAVKGTSQTGGIVGENGRGLVENCYNTGIVTGKTNVGGVIGKNLKRTYEPPASDGAAKAVDCYYLTGTASTGVNAESGADSSGTAAVAQGALANSATFANWSFTDTWAMNKALGRPTLKENPEGVNGIAPPNKMYSINEATETTTFHIPYNQAQGASMSGTVKVTIFNSKGENKASNSVSFSDLPVVSGAVTMDADVNCVLNIGDRIHVVITPESN